MKQILGVTNHDDGFTHRISHAEFDMPTSPASITSLGRLRKEYKQIGPLPIQQTDSRTGRAILQPFLRLILGIFATLVMILFYLEYLPERGKPFLWTDTYEAVAIAMGVVLGANLALTFYEALDFWSVIRRKKAGL